MLWNIFQIIFQFEYEQNEFNFNIKFEIGEISNKQMKPGDVMRLT